MRTKSLTTLLSLFIISIAAQNSNLKDLEKKDKESMEEISNLFFRKNKEKEAYVKSLKLMKEGNSDAGKSLASNLLSSYFYKANHLDSSIFYAKKTLGYKNFSSDSIKRHRYLLGTMTLATAYTMKGIKDKAKKLYIEGVQKAELWNDTYNYYGFVINLGNIYYLDKEYDKALKMFKKGIKSPELRAKLTSYASIGNIYAVRKEFKKSNEYYKESLKYTKGSLYNKLAIKTNIADNYIQLGEVEKGIKKLKEIIKQSKKEGYSQLREQAEKFLVQLYIRQKKYDEAERLITSLLEKVKEKGNLNDMLECYDFLKQIKKGKGDFKNSLIFSEKYIKLKDSINKLQKEKEINELEVKFETAQKESEITLLKKDQELKEQQIAQQNLTRNIILIAASLIIIAILLLLRFYFQKLKTQKELNKTQEEFSYQKIKALMKNQELELVKASIEGKDMERKRLARGLHDSIGSNMAAIKLQFEKLPEASDKLKKIKDDLNNTYEEIRELSHNLLPKRIRQEDYAEVLKEYISSIDEISDVKISFSVSEKKIINRTEKYLQNEIFSIIQELISNALKHAKASKIEIQLEVVDDLIYLSFEDDGVGFNTKLDYKGIGLKNIEDRIDQLSGTFIIDSHPKRGTLFRMELEKDAYLVNEVV
ncbi:tetratricopeptide repeat-containing sensor histidine kinase [Tenacibaculum sp. M341]|uniref:tetratricopeptide repeat-containing sensor histidine kinase n=1 Tax=Tenacibaculum sp. M341 TaxID=2530339 RepID=UPI00140443DF|nr:ATP-binding protein [Tenacibaculum sp. M341]